MKTLFTDSLILRAWALSDLEDLFAYAKNPRIGPAAGWKPHENREESVNVLCMFIEMQQDWAIVDKACGKVIGSIGLHPDPKRNMQSAQLMGYVLAEEYWGKGLATQAAKRVVQYAFEDLQLDVLAVAHYPFNTRSRRVIEKCGFVYEGTLRQADCLYDGTVRDLMCYSICKNEYLANANA